MSDPKPEMVWYCIRCHGGPEWIHGRVDKRWCGRCNAGSEWIERRPCGPVGEVKRG